MNPRTFLFINLMFILFGMVVLGNLYFKRRTMDSEANQRAPRVPTELKMLPVMIGMVILCTLISCGIPFTLISNRQIAATESTPRIQAVTPDLAGQKVLAEGTISSENSVNEHGLVAFAHYTNARKASKRRFISEATPPLLIQMSGGMAQIEDPDNPAAASYSMQNMLWRHSDAGVVTQGMVRGERVLVIGTVVSGPAGVYLDASIVAVGDRASYLANWQKARLPTPLIVGLTGLGCLACGYGVLSMFTRRAIRRG
jgi:hypothetical protein